MMISSPWPVCAAAWACGVTPACSVGEGLVALVLVSLLCANAALGITTSAADSSQADLRIMSFSPRSGTDAPAVRRLDPNPVRMEAAEQPYDNNPVRLQQFGNTNVNKPGGGYLGASTISIWRPSMRGCASTLATS